MSVLTDPKGLISISTVGGIVEFLANDLGYDGITDGYRREEFGNEYGNEFQFLKDGTVVCRVIEIPESGPNLTKVKSYLKRHGSRPGELFSIIVVSTSAEDNPIDRTIEEEVHFLRVESRMAPETVDIEHDLRFFTVDKSGVAPMYLDYFEGLAVGSREYDELVDPISDVFSVRTITKKFYSEFSEIFRNELKPAIHGLENEEENLNAYAQLVVNRILFLMFVQEKGWLNENREYIQTKYQEAKDIGMDVYGDFFEPLFFEALNLEGTPEKEFLGRIPYLNGGLFDKRDIESEVDIDDKFFDVLLDPEEDDFGQKKGFLLQYKISLSETNPAEQELVVDPEFIGRIFEMFMQSEDRKDKGAFYTPKEITQYMSKNSLKQYLINQFPELGDEINQLLGKHEVWDTATNDVLQEIKEVIQNARIVDPAVGSGAFIISTAEELVEVVRCINSELGKDESRFELKEQFIAENLYGVDIDPGGIELCKFRTWLYLMQDLEIGLDEFLENNGQYALPNLEFKFFVGNSIAGDFEPTQVAEDLGKGYQATLVANHNENGSLLTEIAETRKKYVNAHGQDKKELARKLQNLTKELDESVNWKDSAHWMADVVDTAKKEFDLEHQAVFKWSVNIPEVILNSNLPGNGKGGFDIVIGNPPYQGDSRFKQDYVGVLSRFYDQKYDFYKTIPRMRHELYQKFIIRGRELLHEDGVLSYITSRTYMTIGSKESTRRLLQDNRLHELVIANPDTFDAAVKPAVFTLTKKNTTDSDYNFTYINAEETDTSQYRSFVSINPQNISGGISEFKISDSLKGYSVPISIYRNTIRRAFFEPTDENLKVHEKYMANIRELSEQWHDEIQDSDALEDNFERIKEIHLNSLSASSVSILGLLTLGGVGIQTGDVEEYTAYLDESEDAKKIKSRNEEFDYVQKNENTFRYRSRVIKDEHVRDPSTLSDEEKREGIDGSWNDRTWVPIEKGFKEGETYYKEVYEYVNWSKEAVEGIKRDGLIKNIEYSFEEGIVISTGGFSDLAVRYTEGRIIGAPLVIFTTNTGAISPKYLVGILLSQTVNKIAKTFLNSAGMQTQDIRHIPIVIPSSEERQNVEELVSEAIEIRKGESQTSIDEIQSELDGKVSEIYGVGLE